MLLMRGAWLVVIVVGVFVLSLVFALQLFHRLDDAQTALDDADHLFSDELVLAQRNASDAVNLAVNDVLDPIMTEQGGAAAEVPQLITFVADNSDLSEAEVLAALEENVPHTTALLLAIPLEDVTVELPDLIALVSGATGLSEEEVSTAIQENFPALASAIDGLPTITGEWFTLDTGLTDVDGAQLTGIPGIAEYVDTRIVDVTERQRVNYQHTNTIWPNLKVIPWLLVVIALVVVAFGSLMLVVEIKTRPLESRGGLDPVASAK